MLAAGTSTWAARPAPDRPSAATRIGTYDSRALGLAYGRSSAVAQELSKLHTDHQNAQAAGDTARAKDLEQEGVSRQIRMHLQVFSNAPVEDALDTIRDRLPDVAERMRVVGIVSALDYHDATVEPVDVTDELVKLFDPSAETLKLITECRRREPMAIEEVAQLPADE